MDFERLGAFYLGKEYDMAGGKILDRLLMYDARDLTTHAVCVGMTGSGKTGLCIVLLEEAAIDSVPAILLDPKGDITNMLLTFPDLRPEDMLPWVNVDDARRKKKSPEEFAAQQAEQWRKGLADWGQDGKRIQALREAAEFLIFTPGSEAGLPVSILHSFAAPPLSWDEEAELLRERIQGTVSALLGLVGVEADPVRSREHILLSNLIEHFWRRGEDLDLAKLILSIQDPPMRKLGVFEMDAFFPKEDRFQLALTLNNLIAAPGFETWLNGQPLDIPSLLWTPQGKPRHSIFYIAHLSDAERMFFVTMLLNQIVTWMRTQSGTTSLRALLYMDEVFGYFPPVANPPSKRPLLTLLKQARAFGLGVVLTTQNPVDLDYKGLTNAGTWFIGRLQAERDKTRLLDGLESVSSEAGEELNRAELGRLISALDKRVFLLHNVHEGRTVPFYTRWAMSYLRGPLTRTQIQTLMEDIAPDQPAPPPQPTAAPIQPPSAAAQPEAGAAPETTFATTPPSLPPAIQQVYLPVLKGPTRAAVAVEEEEGAVEVESSRLLYVPAFLGIGQVYFVDQRKGVNEKETFALLAQSSGGATLLAWEQAQSLEIVVDDLSNSPEPEASFDQLPEVVSGLRSLTSIKKTLSDYLYHNRRLTLRYSPALGIYSHPGEEERDFLARLQQAARERRDQEVDEIEEKYEDKLDRLEEKLRRAESRLARKQADAQARQRETLVSVGESVVGLFIGRRSLRAASTALSKQRQMTLKKLEVEEAETAVSEVKEDIKKLEEELKKEVEAIRERWDKALENLEEVQIRPRRTDVQIGLFALAWMPHWQVTYKKRGGVAQTRLVPACC